MVKTFMAKKEAVDRNWYVVDATGKPLGAHLYTACRLRRLRHRYQLRQSGAHGRQAHKENVRSSFSQTGTSQTNAVRQAYGGKKRLCCYARS